MSWRISVAKNGWVVSSDWTSNRITEDLYVARTLDELAELVKDLCGEGAVKRGEKTSEFPFVDLAPKLLEKYECEYAGSVSQQAARNIANAVLKSERSKGFE